MALIRYEIIKKFIYNYLFILKYNDQKIELFDDNTFDDYTN
jgi:hypothetical protein